MTADRREVSELSLDELADWLADRSHGPQTDMIGTTEFLYRQTLLQKKATDATIETALYTRQNARYMLWSVVALALSSIATLLVTVYK
jgi:hypothetical protein